MLSCWNSYVPSSWQPSPLLTEAAFAGKHHRVGPSFGLGGAMGDDGLFLGS